tara:strand:+ start:88 stop:540 length:453 start_codon:yes stop_codon:yes gene_type:complete
MKKIAYGLIGFVIFILIGFFIYGGFFVILEEIFRVRFNYGFIARLGIWIILAFGIFGYHSFASEKFSNSLISKYVVKIKKKIDLTNKYVRVYLVSWLLYDFIYIIYLFSAEPYGYRIRGDEWLAVLSWMFLLPMVLVGFVLLYKWALKGK